MILPRPALPLLLCALTLAACGGEERAADADVVGTTASTASAPVAEPDASPATATAPAAGTTGGQAAADDPATATLEEPDANPGGASAEEAQPGGAAGEEPIRQPARFELGSVTLEPASVAVAPFLAVELTVANVDEGFHAVKLIGTDVAFEVQGGQTETRRLPGLPKGVYTLSVDGGEQAASLVVGDEAGP